MTMSNLPSARSPYERRLPWHRTAQRLEVSDQGLRLSRVDWQRLPPGRSWSRRSMDAVSSAARPISNTPFAAIEHAGCVKSAYADARSFGTDQLVAQESNRVDGLAPMACRRRERRRFCPASCLNGSVTFRPCRLVRNLSAAAGSPLRRVSLRRQCPGGLARERGRESRDRCGSTGFPIRHIIVTCVAIPPQLVGAGEHQCG